MSKNILLLAAIGGAVFLVLQKQAQAATTTAATPAKTTTPATVNVNGDMWARVLGSTFAGFINSAAPGSTSTFLKNTWGQITTSDGKPVYTGDPLSDFGQASPGLSSGNVDYVGQMFPNLDTGLENLGWTL